MKNKKTLLIFCLFLFIAGTIFFLYHKTNDDGIPKPKRVQIGNPLMKVDSLKKMESYLNFSVPVLDKEIDRYIVVVMDEYPSIGRIYYADGCVYNIQYGTGDISGIYGGVFEREMYIGNNHVYFYRYEDIYYAIWEYDGFTHSYSGGNNLKRLEYDLCELLLDYVPWKK